MTSDAQTPQEYIASLPDDRRDFVQAIRKMVNDNLPKGFVEAMGYGMMGWAVPHSLYPEGYQCDPTQPLSLAGMASQKGSVNFYLMGLYADPLMLAWFQKEWAVQTTARLDMGKSCIRFKRLEQVPLKLIGELMTIREFVTQLGQQGWLLTALFASFPLLTLLWGLLHPQTKS